MKSTRSCLLLALMLASTPGRAAGQDWQIGSTPSFSSGRYGTDTRTSIMSTPITARRLFDAGDLTVVLPFTCISGNGAVTFVNGSPVRTERNDAIRPTGAGADTRPNTSRGESTAAAVDLRRGGGVLSQPVRQCGMGDIVVRGRYYLLDERDWLPTVAVRAHLKAPTASAERGLGTGRPDEGVGVEVSRTLPGSVMAMVDGGYTVIGAPAGVAYENLWWYDFGVGKDLARGIINLSVFFEEYRAIVPGFESAREVLATLTAKHASGWRLQMSGQFGLSDGAPDHGVTVGASRRF